MSATDRAADGRRPVGTAAGPVGSVVRSVVRSPGTLVHSWRRSIQVRVVIGVLSLSAVLSFAAGWLLLHEVRDGLVLSQRTVALPQAAAGFDTAQSRLNAEDVTGVCAAGESGQQCGLEFGTFLNQLIDVLAPRQGATTGDYTVVVIGPLANVEPGRPQTWAARQSGALDVSTSVPTSLVAQVQDHTGSWWAYTGTQTGPAEPSRPALVVGSQVRVTSLDLSYGLLYVFPLAEQQQTLSVVQRGLFGAGAVLVVLLSTIAWLVTRQVVTPVRLARRIAERLAAGRLEERMHVRGEDDIARLGVSFNQMASSLQRQIRQLEELSRVQRRFVADVSHELRTPLTTVRMASDLLYEARTQFDGPTQRAAELLQDELNRFEGLLTDLLEISRFDAGAAALELSNVDLSDVARQVVTANRPLAHRSGSEILLATPPEPATVQADVRRLQRIIRNLVTNAIQYGEGRDIDVTVHAEAASVSLSVRDRGVGLKPGEEILAFNRFWRADPARVRTHGGTGLGLSIAVEDTALHGGVLEARGAPGAGSVFRLTLPRRAGGPIAPAPIRFADDSGAPVGAPYAHLDPGAEQL